jgi:Transcriptional Coactivator p15 (PC4)
LDCRWPTPALHPPIHHPEDHALGEGGVMTDAIIVSEWTINNRREKVRVSIEQFNGTWLINVRKWFEAEDGAMRPGKQGIALGIKNLPQLVDAMIKAHSVATENQLIQPVAARAGQS